MSAAITLTDEELWRAEAVLVRRSLAAFVRQAWHTIEPGTPLVWNWHIDLICSKLEAVTRGEIQHLVICIPPGFMKSVLISVMWPAWEWLVNPTLRTQFISNADDLATRDSRRCRDVIQSDWYKEIIKALEADWKLKADQNEKINFENTKAGFRQCMSIGAKVTGKRADKQVVDDPHDAKEAILGSTEQIARRMNEVAETYDGVLASRLNDLATGARVVIMQRLHEADLAAHCIKNGYEVLCLPMEYEPDHPQCSPDDPRTEPGELLFPEKFTPAVVARLKANPLSHYESQYQQRPVARGGTLFQREWCPRYDHLPAKEGEYIQSWDFRGGGAKDAGSYAIGMLFWRSNETPTKLYLVDLWRDRWSPSESEEVFRRAATQEPWCYATKRVVENKADGVGIIDRCKHTIPGIIGIKPTTDKETRARHIQAYIHAGDLVLPNYAAWLGEFEREFFRYPGTTNDDQVDTVSQIYNHLFMQKNAWAFE